MTRLPLTLGPLLPLFHDDLDATAAGAAFAAGRPPRAVHAAAAAAAGPTTLPEVAHPHRRAAAAGEWRLGRARPTARGRGGQHLTFPVGGSGGGSIVLPAGAAAVLKKQAHRKRLVLLPERLPRFIDKPTVGHPVAAQPPAAPPRPTGQAARPRRGLSMLST